MSLTAKFPPPLKPGGTIGIVAPSRWPQPEWLEKATEFFKKRGYGTAIHSQNYLKNGQLAGSDADRAKGIANMFADGVVDAIICARGGANANRLLDKLDYDLIKRYPKPFIGFSDMTILLQAIRKNCGFVTYHGPMVWNFAHDHDARTADDMFGVICGQKKILSIPGINVVREGVAEGTLIGGNITRLELLMGTKHDWSAKDCILFIEDVDEVIYKIDEKLHHLKQAGRFDGVRAVIVGEMIGVLDGETGFVRAGETPYGPDLRKVFMDTLPPDIPLCFQFPCGHGKYLTTLPMGAPVKLTLGKRGAEIDIHQV